MNCEFVAEDVSTAGGLDGVHVADDVGDGGIGRRELFDVALIAGHPANRGVVAVLLDELLGVLRDRGERIVVHFTAGHDRHLLVEQGAQRAEDTGLRLAAQAEQNEVVARKERVHDLRHHGVFVAKDATEQRAAGLQARDQVAPDLVFDGLRAIRGVAGALERAEGLGESGHWSGLKFVRRAIRGTAGDVDMGRAHKDGELCPIGKYLPTATFAGTAAPGAPGTQEAVVSQTLGLTGNLTVWAVLPLTGRCYAITL